MEKFRPRHFEGALVTGWSMHVRLQLADGIVVLELHPSFTCHLIIEMDELATICFMVIRRRIHVELQRVIVCFADWHYLGLGTWNLSSSIFSVRSSEFRYLEVVR